MAYRGSLQQCITYLFDCWKTKDIDFLAIICHPRAKYYSVCTDEQLAKPEYEPDTGEVRLVFRGTQREMKVFLDHPQRDLFKEQTVELPKNDRTDGQQPHGDDSPRSAE